MIELRNHFRQDVDDFLFCSTLLLDQEDGVISCDGSKNLRNIAVVDVVGDTARISRT